MEKSTKICIERLKQIAEAKAAAKKAEKDATENARLKLIGRIREYCVPRMGELAELAAAYYTAFPDAEPVKVTVAEKQYFRRHNIWNPDITGKYQVNAFGIADNSQSYATTYNYLVTEDGQYVLHEEHHGSTDHYESLKLDNMPYWVASEFVRGFEEWERTLFEKASEA